MCPKCDEHSPCGCIKVKEITGEGNNDDSCSLKLSQLSTVCTMYEGSAPNRVYKRKKLRGHCVPNLLALRMPNMNTNGADCLSVVSSGSPLTASNKEHQSELYENKETSHLVCNGEPRISKSEAINICSISDANGSDEALKNCKQKSIEVDSAHDSCSSSKSNMEPFSVSIKREVDEAGECSSSSVTIIEEMREDLSGKDLCIFILKYQGLLSVLPRKSQASAKDIGTSSGSSCSRPCKTCGRRESVLNMLICDNCEEAFHVSCCNSRMKKVLNDEWFCHSCLKKKHKILKETSSSKSTNITSEMGKQKNASSRGESNAIALMLRDTEPYTTGVRIGKGFQAEVPAWSGPITNDFSVVGEVLEVDPSEPLRVNEQTSFKPSKFGSVSNWLQCRDVMDGVGVVEGTICGKWRRAPLFEVQTDDWDCYCAVLWDPIHADCAVPQELETDQVLKQLKYIERLRPRLAAKRQKMDGKI